MGTKCAPPYACLLIGYKEETILFLTELPKDFTCQDIQTLYGRRILDMA